MWGMPFIYDNEWRTLHARARCLVTPGGKTQVRRVAPPGGKSKNIKPKSKEKFGGENIHPPSCFGELSGDLLLSPEPTFIQPITSGIQLGFHLSELYYGRSNAVLHVTIPCMNLTISRSPY